jgi:hypothetical protein
VGVTADGAGELTAQELSYDRQIDAGFQQVAGEAVPQGVRRATLGQAGILSGFGQDLAGKIGRLATAGGAANAGDHRVQRLLARSSLN